MARPWWVVTEIPEEYPGFILKIEECTFMMEATYSYETSLRIYQPT
jgi:hypothetical protein